MELPISSDSRLNRSNLTNTLWCNASEWFEPTSVELHRDTGPFEGPSTEWATAPRPNGENIILPAFHSWLLVRTRHDSTSESGSSLRVNVRGLICGSSESSSSKVKVAKGEGSWTNSMSVTLTLSQILVFAPRKSGILPGFELILWSPCR